jgi:hypothetical protein
MLKMLIAHQPRSRVIRLRNKWVEMDPRGWNADMDLSISVGLGMGNKAEQIASADAVLQTYALLEQSPYSTLINEETVYNAVKRKFTAAGIKNIDDFLIEPERDEQGNMVEKPKQPSPEEQKAMAELQMKQMDQQAKAQESAAKLQLQQQESQLKAELAREEAAAKIQLEREKAQAEIAMNEQRLHMEAQLAERKMALSERQAERDAARRDRESELRANRPGGDLDK